MNLAIWLPAMLLLGLGGMGLCLAFLAACERIWGGIPDALPCCCRIRVPVRLPLHGVDPARVVL